MLSADRRELLRYVINGLVATAFHYSVLLFNLNVLSISSAAIANFLAATVAIAASFIGSRYFVFRASNQPAQAQALSFVLLYGAAAFLHGLILLVWTDWLKLDFRIGFLLATCLQVLLSYFGNKYLVFKTAGAS
jgi:putative flippase GtrA